MNYNLEKSNPERNPSIQVISYLSPLLLAALSLLSAIHFQLSLILTVIIPTNTILIYTLVWILVELKSSRKELFQSKEKTTNTAYEIEKIRNEIQKIERNEFRKSVVPLPLGMFEMYIDYKRLDVTNFVEILSVIESIYILLYGVSKRAYSEDNIHHGQIDIERIDEILRSNPHDRLEIHTINSEESIRMRAKTGWLPAITNDNDNDITWLEMPTGAIVLIYLGGLLGGAIKYGSSVRLDILQGIKTEKEISLMDKQEKKLDFEIQKFEKELSNAPIETREEINKKLNKFVDCSVFHHDIRGIKVRSEKKTKQENKRIG